MSLTYGPAFRWFAWRPCWTEDRGWRWLRMVWRRRSFHEVAGLPAMSFFDSSVRGWGQ